MQKNHPAINETDKMKIKTLLGVLIIILSLPTYSQNDASEKQVFVYKTVDGHEIKANIFLPSNDDLNPLLIYFHGGGFMFGNRDLGLNNDIKEKLLKENYAVVSADYRLAPETKLSDILTDVKDIIKWLRKNGFQQFNIDTNRIAVAGGSAGGYLALTTGFEKTNAPNAIVAISTPTGFSSQITPMGDLKILNQPGPYDIVTDSAVSYGDYYSRMTLWRFLIKNGLVNYEVFGFDPATEQEKLDNFSLNKNINLDFPATLLIHAKNDHLVDLQQVKEFHSFLLEKNIKSELYIVENGHSSELIKQNPQAIDKMIRFLKEYMP